MLVPVNLDMGGVDVLCVGGGPVATRKVVPLSAAGAVITVISPQITGALAGVVHAHEARRYQTGDLTGRSARLVVAATGLAEVDDLVADEAARASVWCLRADGQGDMSIPAVVRRGRLVLAMSTSVPSLSRALRVRMDDALGPEWEHAADALGALREDPVVRSALQALPEEERRDRWRAVTSQALSGAGLAALRRSLLSGPAG